MPAPPITDPSAEEAIALFNALEEKFPSQTLGTDKWYLMTISAITGTGCPEHAATLYNYLISKPEFATSASRQQLMRRLREALVKDISILGVCKPLEAIFAIAKIERPEDRDISFSRENWKSGPENIARGVEWLNQIYKANQAQTDDTLSAHQDFAYITRELTYGFYLSDHSILDPIETELVVLVGIMIQNLPLETAWHLRGIRRVGVCGEDVEAVQQCIEMIAEFAGVSLHKVPRVKDIEDEV